MRQVIVQVPSGHGEHVMQVAERFDAVNMARTRATDAARRETDVVVLHVDNDAVGPLVDALEAVPDLHVSMIPSGALALRPPAEEVARQLREVSPRSPLEVYVAGLQSIGSWTAFVGFAVLGAVVVWLGLFTDRVYLLVGAMLIAPFAGPAITAAIATARGDLTLLGRSLLRYGVALVVTAGVAALLSLLFGLGAATELMASTAAVSSAALVLPLAAGAAGALHLCQGEQNSLVSGAAAGMLIAASLAPPAGVVGMAAVSGDLDMLAPALFLLALQLVGINLAGSVVFRLFGMTPDGPRYVRGRQSVRWTSLGLTGVGLAALLAWQFGSTPPTLQRASLEQRMRSEVLTALAADSGPPVIEARLRFTRASIPEQNSLLAVLYVRRPAGATASDDAEIGRRVAAVVRSVIASHEPNVTPLVAVTVVPP